MGNEKKSEKPVQESSIQRLKKQYPDGLNFASGRFGHKKIGVNRFVVQEANGLRFVEDKGDAFVLVEKMKWEDLPEQLYADKLFLKAFYYSDEKEKNSVLTLSRADDGDKICREIEQRRQVTLKKRKVHQRIVGFRSGATWKSAIAIGVYALMLFFVIGLFTGNDDEAVAKPTVAKKEQAVKTEEKESKQIAESKKSEQKTSTETSPEVKKETKSKPESKESIFDVNDVYGKFDDPDAVETTEEMYKNEDEEKQYVVADGVVFQTVKFFDDLNVEILATTDFEFLINHAKDSMPADVELKKTLKENKEFIYYSKSTKKKYNVVFGITENDHVYAVFVSQYVY